MKANLLFITIVVVILSSCTRDVEDPILPQQSEEISFTHNENITYSNDAETRVVDKSIFTNGDVIDLYAHQAPKSSTSFTANFLDNEKLSYNGSLAVDDTTRRGHAASVRPVKDETITQR